MNIDFSCKKDVYIKNEDGTYTTMDVPYFQADNIAPGVWKVMSDGDYSWLVAGEQEALAIDSGYGAGNIRAFMQSLTDKPVKKIANTHYHFDHTANNSYFECAFMSEVSRSLATIPYPSFEGIDFSRNYSTQVIDEGYSFELGGRKLETLEISDHTPGGLVFLDQKFGILFSGDEIDDHIQRIGSTVENFHNALVKIEKNLPEIKVICAGFGVLNPRVISDYIEATYYLLNGYKGKLFHMAPISSYAERYRGRKTYLRFQPRPEDIPQDNKTENKDLYLLEYNGRQILYQTDKIYN